VIASPAAGRLRQRYISVSDVPATTYFDRRDGTPALAPELKTNLALQMRPRARPKN